MKKQVKYPNTRFEPRLIEEARLMLVEIAANEKKIIDFQFLSIEAGEVAWQYDTFEEFYAELRKSNDQAYLDVSGGGYQLCVHYRNFAAIVVVQAPHRAAIERVFSVFENARASSIFLPPRAVEIKAESPVVFIGHGHSNQWRDLKDHLHEKHGIQVQAYETGARAGHTIRDILEDLAESSSFAVLIHTAEDAQPSGAFYARQNVVHETGLFQGKLGYPRAIVLLEEDVEEFSNIAGVQQVRFSRSNIRETFGEVLATIRREFGPI